MAPHPMPLPNQAPQPTDAELVERARQRDERAFGELVRRYWDKVFARVMRLVRDSDQADSLTSEAFNKAFKSLDDLKSADRFPKWVLKIVENAALKRLDREKADPLSIEGSLMEDTPNTYKYPALQVSSREESPLEEVVSRESDNELRRAMAQLRPEYQMALRLHLKEIKHEEIARMMGLPLNTVDSHISRARKELKEALREPGKQ